MPKTDKILYRGGYKNSPWPSDFNAYLIRRAEQDKDCKIYVKDDEYWVEGDELRGLSLFAVKGTINNPWKLSAGATYSDKLTLIENPSVKNDWILAPAEDMKLDEYIKYVKSIEGWEKDFAMDMQELAALDPAMLRRLLRQHVQWLIKQADAADGEEGIEYSNDAQLLSLVLDGLERGTTKVADLQGTAAALVGEAVGGRSATQDNVITIGKVTTPNPALWLDTSSLDKPIVKYEVATDKPGGSGQWTMVNQFCSILAVRFLQKSPMPKKFGFTELANQVGEAQRLLGFKSLDDQLNWANGQLDGVIIKEDLADFYREAPVGSRFWLGNDAHVWAVVKGSSNFWLYDPDNGQPDQVRGSDFGGLVLSLGVKDAVMAAPI
ncbi:MULTISPECIES: hypothetical protein [unclassified Bradyrhizobium]|uniref:hypothetical protein n=1 Tax=unclassified Bradyrhizobium TaxID=2631580 RepID=UPI0028E94F6D|nr:MULTISPECIES: hypothetical protein [unclassified Bradyrhizobium]